MTGQDNNPPYQLIRSKRRTLGISIEKGNVIVRAPNKAPTQWINQFILEKQAWIRKHRKEQLQKLNEVIRLADGCHLKILDHDLKLHIVDRPEAKKASITYQKNKACLIISGAKLELPHIKHLFTRWLSRQASQYMDPLTQEIAEQLQLDHKLTRIRYRRSKSQWGHCTSEGVIQYNPLIIMSPTWVVRYIICHELCHLQHRNHSKRFWRLVDSIYKQREAAEEWLNENGHRISLEYH